MVKKMLIDAAHPEETRVVVLDGQRVDDFDFETLNKRQLRGNIYLAKVTRVEPSLQAAFVEFGGNRHGFLAFGEIHPDYYQIPIADREKLKAEFDASHAESAAEEGAPSAEDDDEAVERAEEERRRMLVRRYKIQEVIRRRQIMLVQVVKEERGNKGAALTTYLSLAGRYCVLMPNTGRGGGISRKITSGPDRKRLKKIATDLDVAKGMGLIIRTAGAKRTKTEIKRDYEYLTRAWENIRDLTLRSVAPSLIYEESSLVKRAIRDLYDKDVGEIYVEGDGAYREAKDFVRMLMPSHAKRVHHFRESTPIFAKNAVERQLENIYSPTVNLKSGGYIVINQTEALVAIDVNSGRATRERGIEQTALKTNLEAADEAARQIRLRDLAGLIVIDFIDMEESKNDRAVEKRVKDALRFDRARVQMGKISDFGLMELSRQRRRTGVLEGSSHVCEHCQGSGRVRSVESSALKLLRAIDEEAVKGHGELIEARAPTEVALYLLNEKRTAIAAMEEGHRLRIRVVAAPGMMAPDFELASSGERSGDAEAELARENARKSAEAAARDAAEAAQDALLEHADDDDAEETEADGEREGEGEAVSAAERPPRQESEAREGGRRRRRRGRRGGKRREEGGAPNGEAIQAREPGEEGEGEAEAEPMQAGESAPEGDAPPAEGGERKRRRRRRRGGRGGENAGATAGGAETAGDAEGDDDLDTEEAPVAAIDRGEQRLEAAPDQDDDDPDEPPAPALAALAAFDPEPPAAQAADRPEYSPDHERRAKFFARLNRWGKKEAS